MLGRRARNQGKDRSWKMELNLFLSWCLIYKATAINPTYFPFDTALQHDTDIDTP